MEIKECVTTNSEFNETKKLVEAVLERLTFHAFEDVLIWSNEHASRALTRCLKKTLEEFENDELVLTSSYPKLKHFSVDNVVNGLMTTIDQAQERQVNLYKEIEELTSQLAKSQTTPEGFVLVPHDVADRCMSHITLAMCHPNNTNAENDVMQMDLDILESKVEAQEQRHD